MVRKPAVSGRFYDSDPSRLRSQVERYSSAEGRKKAIALMAPHAGLMFSGPVAGLTYSSIDPPSTFLLLGPNHTGRGAGLAIMPEGKWECPMGTLDIDAALATALIEQAPELTADSEAHMMEHSLEVQLPFIIHNAPGARIVPIAFMRGDLDTLEALGLAAAGAIKAAGYPVVIAASSDMSHFLPDEEAREKDRIPLEKVVALDPSGLYRTVREEDISMCGYLPTVTTLFAALALGATKAELVSYATSGEASGDFSSVVGYAGVVIS